MNPKQENKTVKEPHDRMARHYHRIYQFGFNQHTFYGYAIARLKSNELTLKEIVREYIETFDPQCCMNEESLYRQFHQMNQVYLEYRKS